MKLKDIHLRIQNSTSSDWHLIKCAIGVGPSYHNRYDWALGSDSHHSTLVFIQNVALTISWGMVSDKDMRPAWLKRFPECESVDYRIGDVFWNGSLIDRYRFASVGGRAVLPVPHAVYETGLMSDPSAVSFEVPRFHRAFARLIDRARPVADFDRCYADAGFITVDNSW